MLSHSLGKAFFAYIATVAVGTSNSKVIAALRPLWEPNVRVKATANRVEPPKLTISVYHSSLHRIGTGANRCWVECKHSRGCIHGPWGSGFCGNCRCFWHFLCWAVVVNDVGCSICGYSKCDRLSCCLGYWHCGAKSMQHGGRASRFCHPRSGRSRENRLTASKTNIHRRLEHRRASTSPLSAICLRQGGI